MAKVALVTGGSRGIGLGIVTQLASQGFNIAINGVRPQEGVTEVLESIKALGVEVIYCQGNVALSADRAKILQEVKDHYGQLNILVNNAGIAPRERRDVLSTSETSFDEVLDTNLKSCYFLTQAAANWMIEQKAAQPDFSASIINISSISATVASVNRGEYCVSKAGISMVTQLFAVRLGEYNIPVYEVRPGVIATDMTAGVKEKYDNLIGGGLCVQPRWGTPEDVGKAVGALAAGGFPYSTGQVFMVDGGLTLSRL
ncbi:MAG: 3-ketoacyl-ACP reductase [Haliscomenobacter sp.]|uniref:3-ketoacyl-ACP reductase n=1 Tax=Haliscomenobacter sp. TaxID=2717303 RepID=UPI0029AC0188|nr:3-ketoacyl-ACP reductase [Haliscomenobacter sp.]MDX2072661.1 3-ketoacyl-ACP reductase [Haliscomenobacter sp.]